MFDYIVNKNDVKTIILTIGFSVVMKLPFAE